MPQQNAAKKDELPQARSKNPPSRQEDAQIKTRPKKSHSRVDNNALKHAFASFQQAFETQVDLYYKNYNRYI